MRWTIAAGLSPQGTVAVPGDKSITHRALILASVAEGQSRLGNFPAGADVGSTARCLVQLGVPVVTRPGTVQVRGVGMRGLQPASEVLDCGNSGTTMRLLAGLVAGQPFDTTLDGDASLRGRPMRRVAEPLELMGARVTTTDGHAPLEIHGGSLKGVHYTTPVPSAQVKSSVLLAALFARKQTIVREGQASRDHTERMLTAMGANIRGAASDEGVLVRRGRPLTPLQGRIPGDVSSAAYWLVAAALAPGSDLVLEYVGNNPTRTAIIDLLRDWGADIVVTPGPDWAGEPTATLRIRGKGAPLTGGRIAGSLTTLLLDELPLLGLLGALTRDGVEIADAAELRVKESDRIRSTAAAIEALGGTVTSTSDGLVVPGGQRLQRGVVDAAGDHRVALAAAAIAPGVAGGIEVEGAEVADVSYPGFLAEFNACGADR